MTTPTYEEAVARWPIGSVWVTRRGVMRTVLSTDGWSVRWSDVRKPGETHRSSFVVWEQWWRNAVWANKREMQAARTVAGEGKA